MPSPQLSIAFDPTVEVWLRAEAQRRSVSMALIVREIVARHFAAQAGCAATTTTQLHVTSPEPERAHAR